MNNSEDSVRSNIKRQYSACAIGIFIWIATFVVVNTIAVKYWYYPIKDMTYSSHTCVVKYCKTDPFSTVSGSYMNATLVIEYNNYSAYAYIFQTAYVSDYCNITKTMVCYSYDADITSLTITENDLKHDTTEILLLLILVIDLLGFLVLGLIIGCVCSAICNVFCFVGDKKQQVLPEQHELPISVN